ncbi:alpha/beta fold hydrolase [Naasia lichenicola]|uniref:Alpha/beta fold hydrolase n=1 Tax=Naasia lichenicola TaxID=2565933 RepID=A0A4S4FQH8_9MICO|nr:alpha/beta fold hydrolase [Naasia lichenicola]THG32819.1 alpha/beta fold hydrolase [Naasia lichenicola]
MTDRSVRGLVLREHRIQVPLDYGKPDGPTIEVFAREVAAPDGTDRPFLLFLQGGPGFESPRTPSAAEPGWIARALKDYRVVLLDQRGTGLSTPFGHAGDPEDDARYLTNFRADSIVQDAERMREHLGAKRWSVLGQSFGGFCALHYLTVHPESLEEVIFTGGLPPIGRSVDDVYATTFRTMRRLNREYHRRFPQDQERLDRVLALSAAGKILGPSGEVITPRLLRTLGHHLGMDGGAEELHFLLELDPASLAFSHDVMEMLPFGTRNPIYSVLHESSYADGVATRWSSHRVQPEDFADGSSLLTAEHIYPWHFEDMPGLRPYAQAAELLAQHEWPRLFDLDVLSRVDVTCAAVIYVDDPYVDRALSEETADVLPGLRRWVTNEHLHNGLRTGGERVLDRLIGLARGTI